MKVSEFMKKDVACVKANDNVVKAAQILRDKNIGFLPVCDDGQHVLGTITDRDIALRVVAEGMDADECMVERIYTREVVACRPDDDVNLAAELMSRYKKSRLIILNTQDELEGIISLSDVARHAGEVDGGKTLRNVASRESRPS